MKFPKTPTQSNFAAVWLFLGFGAAIMGIMTWWEHANEEKRNKLIPDEIGDDDGRDHGVQYQQFINGYKDVTEDMQNHMTTTLFTTTVTVDPNVTPKKLTKEEEIALINKQIGELRRQYARKLASLMRYRTFRSVESSRLMSDEDRKNKVENAILQEKIVIPEIISVD